MRIGIITIVDITNYGNRLQNYAVYHILKNHFKYKSTTIAARTENNFYNDSLLLWLKNQFAKKLCIFPSFAEKIFGNNITRWSNFTNWSKLIPTKFYYSHKYLPTSLNDKYDLFLVGSDQIWNYHFSSIRFNDYFLKFADDEKKNAISGSFGVDSIPEEWRNEYITGLKGFKNISVREDAGKEILKDLLGIDVPVLIDPTMMLTPAEWLKVSKKPRVDCSKPYVLKYYLGDEIESNKIDSWAKKNGYEVYELLNDKIPELYSAGPGEFISLINNASLVCSDSFHCIVFSILFSKPFLVYAREGTDNYMTSRMDTLLNKFGLSHRWYHLQDENDYFNCDYSKIPELLAAEKKQFLDYLTKVFNG